MTLIDCGIDPWAVGAIIGLTAAGRHAAESDGSTAGRRGRLRRYSRISHMINSGRAVVGVGICSS